MSVRRLSNFKNEVSLRCHPSRVQVRHIRPGCVPDQVDRPEFFPPCGDSPRFILATVPQIDPYAKIFLCGVHYFCADERSGLDDPILAIVMRVVQLDRVLDPKTSVMARSQPFVFLYALFWCLY